MQIGTPTDPDFFDGTGLNLTVSDLRQALDDSIVNNTLDSTQLANFFGFPNLPWTFNGSNDDDWIDLDLTSPADDTFFGNGGDDEADFGAGDDTYFGGAGNDYFYDVEGNNTFDGGAGNSDQVSYGDSSTSVAIDLNAGTAIKGDRNH